MPICKRLNLVLVSTIVLSFGICIYLGYLVGTAEENTKTSPKALVMGQLKQEDLMPTIFVVTPTYHRPVQKAELTRLCHTFLLVPKLHWIVVEDSPSKTALVRNFLRKCGVKYTHLNAPTPAIDGDWIRGRMQRNQALRWLRYNATEASANDVIYFGDDDNTYSLKLFDVMRHTKRVSVWPVAFAGGLMVEQPVLGIDLQTGLPIVTGWDSGGPPRKFATDMAGFAVNYNLFMSKSNAMFQERKAKDKIGHLEDEFLRLLVSNLTELEPKSSTEVLVWHTRSKNPVLFLELKRKSPSDRNIEV